MNTIVVGLPWSRLAKNIAQHCHSPFVPVTVTQFADTEVCVSFAHDVSFARAHVVLVFQALRSSGTVMSLNDQAIGLLQIVDELRVRGAQSISLFLPYLLYGRQDVNFDKQLPGAVFMFGRCFAALGVTQLLVCDMHAPAIKTSFAIPIQNIEFVSFWTHVIKEQIIKKEPAQKLCIVSPDRGGCDRARAIAQQLDADFSFIRKVRPKKDAAVGYELIGVVKDKAAVIVDDIINTASTAASAGNLLRSNGALTVYGCFAHAIFSDESKKHIKAGVFKKIFITDTVGGALPSDDCIQQLSIVDFISEQSKEWLKR